MDFCLAEVEIRGETLRSPELKGFKSDLMETMMYVKMEFSFPFLSFQKGRRGRVRGLSVGGAEKQANPSSGPKLMVPVWSHLQRDCDEDFVSI